MIISQRNTFKEAVWNSVSNQSKVMIDQMMSKDPKKRITATEALKSPYFDSIRNLAEDKQVKLDKDVI